MVSFNNFFNYLKNFYKTPSALSSFSNVIAIITWRFSLLFSVGKYFSGIYFAAFSIASFPGTLFNNIFGQTIVLNKSVKNYFEKNYFIIILILSIFICVNIFLLNKYLSNHQNFYLFFITLVSLLGTLIMVAGLYTRHKILFSGPIYQQRVFYRDIILSILVAPIIFILYFIGGKNFLIFSFLFSSILCFVCYKIIKI